MSNITKEQLIEALKLYNQDCDSFFSTEFVVDKECDIFSVNNYQEGNIGCSQVGGLELDVLLNSLNKVLDKPVVKESLTTDFKVGDTVYVIPLIKVVTGIILQSEDGLYKVQTSQGDLITKFIYKTRKEAEQSIKEE